MSQWEQVPTEDAFDAHESGQLRSIGAYLAAQRDLRGITLEELAHLTRIPLRSLARLEDGTYDGVTDGFARGFVRSVAEALGLEPDDTVARMLREPAPEEEADPYRAPILGTAVGATILLVLCVLAVGAIQAVGSLPSSPEPIEAPDVVTRRNAVALLAESERIRRDAVNAVLPQSAAGAADDREPETVPADPVGAPPLAGTAR